MDAVAGPTREGGVREGSSAQLSRLRGEDPAQVDAEEAPGHGSQVDHHEREEQLRVIERIDPVSGRIVACRV